MKQISTLILIVFVAALSSCQKVITVNLNDSAPRYVVEGNITNLPGPYTVKITKSVNFDQDNNFPGVDSALVTITDLTSNIIDTLRAVSSGTYQTHKLLGTAGHTYFLSAVTNGNIFTCTSTMPQQITLDSLYIQKSPFGKSVLTTAVYTDPKGQGNYYNLVLMVNDSTSTEIHIHDDEVIDGNQVSSNLRTELQIHPGDFVSVELQCIDKGVFKYLQTLQQTIRQNSATPANPQTNIAGGALGYFSAHTAWREGIIAP